MGIVVLLLLLYIYIIMEERAPKVEFLSVFWHLLVTMCTVSSVTGTTPRKYLLVL